MTTRAAHAYGTGCLSIGELSDYWTADLAAEEIERIEAHVFACSACTGSAIVRSGRKRPSLSRGITSVVTRVTAARNVGACGFCAGAGGGACPCVRTVVAKRTRPARVAPADFDSICRF